MRDTIVACTKMTATSVADTEITRMSALDAQITEANGVNIIKTESYIDDAQIGEISVADTEMTEASNMGSQTTEITVADAETTGANVAGNQISVENVTESTKNENLRRIIPGSQMTVTSATGTQLTVLNSLMCVLCTDSRVYGQRSSLYRHMRDIHNVQLTLERIKTPRIRTTSTRGHYSCSVGSCKEMPKYFNTLVTYREHLHSKHMSEMTIRKRQLTFDTYEDFEEWRGEQQKKDVAKFIQHAGVDNKRNKLTWRFYCHRSGFFQSRGKQQRQIKTQGSCKSGAICPAAITVVKRNDSGYEVTYYPTHYGHENSLGHLTLSKAQRIYIKGKLNEGLTTDEILNEIRCSMTDRLERFHLISRKDINNARKYFLNRPHGRQRRPPIQSNIDSILMDSSVQECEVEQEFQEPGDVQDCDEHEQEFENHEDVHEFDERDDVQEFTEPEDVKPVLLDFGDNFDEFPSEQRDTTDPQEYSMHENNLEESDCNDLSKRENKKLRKDVRKDGTRRGKKEEEVERNDPEGYCKREKKKPKKTDSGDDSKRRKKRLEKEDPEDECKRGKRKLENGDSEYVPKRGRKKKSSNVNGSTGNTLPIVIPDDVKNKVRMRVCALKASSKPKPSNVLNELAYEIAELTSTVCSVDEASQIAVEAHLIAAKHLLHLNRS